MYSIVLVITLNPLEQQQEKETMLIKPNSLGSDPSEVWI